MGPLEPTAGINESGRPGKKQSTEVDTESERMDNQLESIVRGYSRKPTLSPKRQNTDYESKSTSSTDLPTKKQTTERSLASTPLSPINRRGSRARNQSPLKSSPKRMRRLSPSKTAPKKCSPVKESPS